MIFQVIWRRVLSLIPLLLLVSAGIFALVLMVPGDAATQLAGGDAATADQVEAVREELGLGDPFVVQYMRWLGDAVQFDFGSSLRTGADVSSEILERLPVTLSLAAAALVVGLVVGVPSGVLAGMRPGSLIDRISLAVSSLGIAVPSFWLAMILVTIFAVNMGWLPAVGMVPFSESPLEWLRSVILPATALGLYVAAAISRQLRSGLVNELRANYVRTAWAKGSTSRRVVLKHAMKNAAIPVITVIGLHLGTLLGGSVVVEAVFAIPGLGTYFVDAIFGQDLPAVQGLAVMYVLINVTLNLLVDLTYGYLNPKVRVAA